jgi:hypothetical protein
LLLLSVCDLGEITSLANFLICLKKKFIELWKVEMSVCIKPDSYHAFNMLLSSLLIVTVTLKLVSLSRFGLLSVCI